MKKLILSVLFAAALLTGCGSNGKLLTDSEYVSVVKGRSAELLQTIQHKIDVTDYRTIGKQVAKEKSKLEQAQKALLSIQPPPDYLDEHKVVAYVIDNMIKGDECLINYSKNGSASELAKANGYFNVAWNSMDDAPDLFAK